jgi:hypothetical protein
MIASVFYKINKNRRLVINKLNRALTVRFLCLWLLNWKCMFFDRFAFSTIFLPNAETINLKDQYKYYCIINSYN